MAGEKPFAIRDSDVTYAVVMMFGGDNNLNDQVYRDLGEMVAGNTGNVGVLALADFRDRGAIVVELSARVGARVVESWGEIDTGDPDTLTRFLGRALMTYANVRHVAIGFWDHGSGVFNEYDDRSVRMTGDDLTARRGAPTRRRRSPSAGRLFRRRNAAAPTIGLRAMLHDDTNGGLLTTREAGEVLRQALSAVGRAKVALVFSDTCLNGMVEVMHEFAPYAEVVVASEELEPDDGWNYALWLRRVSKLRPPGAAQWASLAVNSFADAYRHRPDLHPVTLAAFRTDSIAARFADLVRVLHSAGTHARDWVERARRDAQSFARLDIYDLGDFLRRLGDEADRAGSPQAGAAARSVRADYQTACVAEAHFGDGVSAASGLGLWVPSTRSELIVTGGTYRQLRWDREVGWCAFLSQ